MVPLPWLGPRVSLYTLSVLIALDKTSDRQSRQGLLSNEPALCVLSGTTAGADKSVRSRSVLVSGNFGHCGACAAELQVPGVAVVVVVVVVVKLHRELEIER